MITASMRGAHPGGRQLDDQRRRRARRRGDLGGSGGVHAAGDRDRQVEHAAKAPRRTARPLFVDRDIGEHRLPAADRAATT